MKYLYVFVSLICFSTINAEENCEHCTKIKGFINERIDDLNQSMKYPSDGVFHDELEKISYHFNCGQLYALRRMWLKIYQLEWTEKSGMPFLFD